LGSSDLLEKTLTGFLEDVAAQTPAPGGGAVAAVAVALGAALAEMVARFSGADEAIAAAAALRKRASPLAQADADAYATFLATRDEAAHARTVAVPLEIAAIGAEVAALAAALAERGNQSLRGDAIAAALVAGAGTTVGAKLVEINLEGRPDERLEQAREQAAAAERAVISVRSPNSPS
jgi:formiminotetrahydrofolate cyclodeaminase